MKKLLLSLALAAFILAGTSGIQTTLASHNGTVIVKQDDDPEKTGKKDKESKKKSEKAMKRDCTKGDKSKMKNCDPKKVCKEGTQKSCCASKVNDDKK